MDLDQLKKLSDCWGGLGTTGSFKFHDKKGKHIRFNRSRTSAYRINGFSHGLCFSQSPLLPGQLFLVEVTDAQDGWSGHLRLGITQCNPSHVDPVPEMVIPDMTTPNENDDQVNPYRSRTWAVAITKFHNRVRGKHKEIAGILRDKTSTERVAFFANQRVRLDDLYFFGRKELTFNSSGTRFPDFGQSTYIGSRIGIVLVPLDDETGTEMHEPGEPVKSSAELVKCNMHIIINGEDQGPSITDIPMTHPLYALVDVYSITKRVNIVPLSSVGNLKDLCRDVIRSRVPLNSHCDILPLPRTMRLFCQYL